MQRNKLLGAMLVVAVLVVGVWVIANPATRGQESQLTREARLRSEVVEAQIERERYAPGFMPAEGEEEENEGDMLLQLGDFWATRVTYPTGRFDQRWLLAAAEQDKQVESRLPAGQRWYGPEDANSPLVLDPDAFTSLGPEPLQSNGCQGCSQYRARRGPHQHHRGGPGRDERCLLRVGRWWRVEVGGLLHPRHHLDPRQR